MLLLAAEQIKVKQKRSPFLLLSFTRASIDTRHYSQDRKPIQWHFNDRDFLNAAHPDLGLKKKKEKKNVFQNLEHT